MSRGYGRLLGRSSSLPFHNMEWILAWVWEDFGKPSHTKKEQTFMRVKYVPLCIYMLQQHSTCSNTDTTTL